MPLGQLQQPGEVEGGAVRDRERRSEACGMLRIADDFQLPRLAGQAHVAEAVLFALRQPAGCEVRELVICPSTEASYP